MKKILGLILEHLICSILFSLPNMSIYWCEDNNKGLSLLGKICDNIIYSEDNDPKLYIKESNIYDIENNLLVGNVKEDKDTITINTFDESFTDSTYIVNKNNGYFLYAKEFYNNMVTDETYFDSETGLIIRHLSYNDGALASESIYNNEDGKKIKVVSYLEDSKIDCHYEFDYSRKNQIIEKKYDSNNILIEKSENLLDPITKRKLRFTKYNSNNIVVEETLYNMNYQLISNLKFYPTGQIKEELFSNPKTGKHVYKNIYTEAGTKEEYSFIEFDSNNRFEIENNTFLQTNIVEYYTLNSYAQKSKSSPVFWNDNYDAIIEKYDFTIDNDYYKYIQFILDNNYLIDYNSVVISNKTYFPMYCFGISNFKIDLASCYKITLIAKKTTEETSKPSYTYSKTDYSYCDSDCKNKLGYKIVTADELKGIYFKSNHINSKVCLKNISPVSFSAGHIYFDPGFISFFCSDEQLIQKLIANKTKKMDVYGHVYITKNYKEGILIDWLDIY